MEKDHPRDIRNRHSFSIITTLHDICTYQITPIFVEIENCLISKLIFLKAVQFFPLLRVQVYFSMPTYLRIRAVRNKH